jgi:UDP-N-acetylglucosamine--N-acetylmuramyl-(pentapeptide) pyrophosphoryl-undecaprenol N-acetylglucosamine transferase
MGIPAILVPYPGAVRDHQRLNARHFADRGAAVMVEQDRDQSRFQTRFADRLQALFSDETRRGEMSQAMRSLAMPEAARKVAKSVRFLVRNWNKVQKR